MIHRLLPLMLLMSITRIAMSQDNVKSVTEKTFDLPANFAKKSFQIDLGKGNQMQIDLEDPADFNRMLGIDGIITGFLDHIAPLKDSLSNELTTKRIDYILDSSETKKIRLVQYPSQGSSFTVIKKELSALKLEQDTINFLGTVYFTAKYTMRKAFPSVRYYRIRFLLNDVSDLKSYIGLLASKIQTLKNSTGNDWKKMDNNTYGLKTDPYIRSYHPGGFVSDGDFAYLKFSVNLQNYKTYFVPSFSLGIGAIVSTNGFFKRDIMLSWDPNFFFDRGTSGNLRTYRNDYLTLTFGQGSIRDKDPRKESEFLTIMSLSYLIHRQGEFIEKRTFRFGGGRLSLFEGKTKIEPSMYFTNFFKGVTPGLRWIQTF